MRLRWTLLAALGLLRVAPAPESWEERLELERAVALNDPAHHPRIEGGAPHLPGARFDDSARVGAIAIGLAAIGREGSMSQLGTGSPAHIAGPEVRFARAPGVVEWWRSLPSGLEQGVTIARRPVGKGPLVLEMTSGEGVRAEQVSDDALVLRGDHGEVLAHYAHLVVLDAARERTPARLAAHDGRIRIEVDDARARYPLVVDPLLYGFEEAVLTAPTPLADDQLGWSVALSDDGSTAIAGAPFTNGATGAEVGVAHVFVRSAGGSWSHQAELIGAGLSGFARFGWSVALSADGNVALVGAPQDLVGAISAAGSARVWRRSGSSWSEEATLTPTGAEIGTHLGGSVALSDDGTVALVGAADDDTTAADAGTARVFVRGATSWSQEATLAHPTPASGDVFGTSVALTPDGSRAIVGAPNRNQMAISDVGSAVVFTRAAPSWSVQGTLAPSSPGPGDHFGSSVAISANGLLALVGATDDDEGTRSNSGTVRSFTFDGINWTEEATILPSNPLSAGWFGESVALSSDGSRALIGMYGDDVGGVDEAGSARVFEHSGSSWTEAAVILPALAGSAIDHFGRSVGLSATGTTALAGADGDDPGTVRNGGSAHGFSIAFAAATGSPCIVGPSCASGNCVDGFCCDSACGGGVNDCQSCSAVLTGGADGTCLPLEASFAASMVCRASANPLCDVEERCTSTSTACPADMFAPSTVVCRLGTSVCDAPERCTGMSAVCPLDDGSPVPPGTECHPSFGPCDPAELCEGLVCPLDRRLPAGVRCGGMVEGSCSSPGACDGTSATCGGGSPLPAGTVCMPRDPTIPCDADDTCDGVSQMCPSEYAPASTVCGPAPIDVCDAPDHCTGSSADCVPTFVSGAECRPSNGPCDAPEVCLGDSASCPADAVESAGMSCRPSTDTSCDPEETCDGIGASCPSDVNTCMGSDAGVREDAGTSGVDAGPPEVITGCACRASAPSRGVPFAAIMLCFGIVFYTRRRR